MYLVRIFSGSRVITAVHAETTWDVLRWARANFQPRNDWIIDINGERFSYLELERALQSMGINDA